MSHIAIASGRDPAILSPTRLQLMNWFRVNARPLAEAYEGAIRLIADKGFPGRVRFIAHAVRDIADRLVLVLDPQLTGTRVQYENEMDRIVDKWPIIRPEIWSRVVDENLS